MPEEMLTKEELKAVLVALKLKNVSPLRGSLVVNLDGYVLGESDIAHSVLAEFRKEDN